MIGHIEATPREFPTYDDLVDDGQYTNQRDIGRVWLDGDFTVTQLRAIADRLERDGS